MEINLAKPPETIEQDENSKIVKSRKEKKY
jgi:hypothetical protein